MIYLYKICNIIAKRLKFKYKTKFKLSHNGIYMHEIHLL